MKDFVLFFWLLVALATSSFAELEKKKGPGEKALLVTAESLREAWEPFVEWKANRGIDVAVVSVKEIEALVEGPDSPEKIRRYVQSQIKNDGLQWLILGGDSLPGGKGLVPDRDTFHNTMWGEVKDIPTDIYYLSATNWDADGDGVYGEFEDDQAAITYPDGTVGLGRIPVRTVEDVAAYTAKVVSFESRYPGPDFANSFLYTCTVGGAYPKVRKSWDGWVSEVLEDGEVSRYFADETPWDGKAAGDHAISAPNWVKLFNEGHYGKIHLHGHGLLHGWVMEDDKSLFGFGHVKQLVNKDVYPMITTVSCFTGHYDAQRDPCIAEAMLRRKEAGAIAIVAPCREGKPHFANPRLDFPLMMKEGKLDGTTLTMTLFWSRGISETLTAGEALMAAKKKQVALARESSNLHLCLCELNLLGDPTLEVHYEGASDG